VTSPLPRYVIAKTLAKGGTAYYFNVTTRYRKLGCPIANEPLGNDYATACGTDGNLRAARAIPLLVRIGKGKQATTAGSDFPRSFIIGYRALSSTGSAAHRSALFASFTTPALIVLFWKAKKRGTRS
jgi:hypothetical protein